MLHIHFGAGRLGLGLVAPFLRTPTLELHLLNRASSGKNPTGGTALDPSRRNELLALRKKYCVSTPGQVHEADSGEPRETLLFEGFRGFESGQLEGVMHGILSQSSEKTKGIVVTASVLALKNYAPVIEALNIICKAKEHDGGDIGDV